MLPTFAKEFRTPAGFGYMNAQFVIKEIESAVQPSGAPHTEWDVPVFLSAPETVLADIGRDLGVGAKRTGRNNNASTSPRSCAPALCRYMENPVTLAALTVHQ